MVPDISRIFLRLVCYLLDDFVPQRCPAGCVVRTGTKQGLRLEPFVGVSAPMCSLQKYCWLVFSFTFDLGTDPPFVLMCARAAVVLSLVT